MGDPGHKSQSIVKPLDVITPAAQYPLINENTLHGTSMTNMMQGKSENARYQDPPCTFNWGYMVPNSRYLGPNRG